MTFNQDYTKNDYLDLQIGNIYKYMDSIICLDNPFIRYIPIGNHYFSELLKDFEKIFKATKIKIILQMEEEIKLLENQKTPVDVDKKILGIHRILKSFVFESNTKQHLPLSEKSKRLSCIYTIIDIVFKIPYFKDLKWNIYARDACINARSTPSKMLQIEGLMPILFKHIY